MGETKHTVAWFQAKIKRVGCIVNEHACSRKGMYETPNNSESQAILKKKILIY